MRDFTFSLNLACVVLKSRFRLYCAVALIDEFTAARDLEETR